MRQSLSEFLAQGEVEPCAVVLVAAGLASDEILWSLVASKPLIAWTVSVFERSEVVSEVALVVPRERLDDARTLWLAENWQRVSVIAAGGASRRESVYIGLQSLTDAHRWVMIHDGARPLVTAEMIAAGVETARRYGAASACEPVAETIKRTSAGVVIETPDRASLVQLQTPQVFDRETLLRVHERASSDADARDDATMAAAAGIAVMTFPGDPDNVSVTSADDLALVEALLGRRSNLI